MGNAKVEGAMQSHNCTIKGPIAVELRRIEEDCIHSGKAQFNAADRWSRYHYWLGIPSVGLSAVAGAAFMKEYGQVEAVDVLWNFQPMLAEVNNYKRARHPKEFFQSQDGSSKYWPSYDSIPEPKDPLWNDHLAFVASRKQQMLASLESLYGLTVVPSDDGEG
ncbi:hypothetical protein KVG95_20875 [Pseudomonas sp. SWRI79]|uniref:Uncharacterized protein n=1 Tax=Pseudomonas farris TaxID=2841207 RepID=A0ABS6PZ90_9PSED|nr:hypothetical protein [Pseudomonas farris]MBV4465789.1 hypothetical protein [Pseudomonas farris]